MRTFIKMVSIIAVALITSEAQAQAVPRPTPRCDTETGTPHLRAGTIAFQQGNFSMAFEEFQGALRACPSSANVRENLALVAMATRDGFHLSLALRLIEEALRDASLRPEQRATLTVQRDNVRRAIASLPPVPTPHPNPGRPVVVHRSRTGGWVATIAGGALLAASIGASIVSAEAAADQAAIERGEYLPNDAVPTTRDVSLGIAIGAGLGGAALTIYGAYLLLRPDETVRTRPNITLLPGGGVLASVSSSF